MTISSSRGWIGLRIQALAADAGSLMLPRLCGDELLAADLIEQRQVVADQRPHDLCRNAFVIVAQYVPDTSNFAPRDVRMACFQIGRQPTAGLGNDLYTALDQPQLAPVALENIKGHARYLAANMVDGLDDVRQARDWRWFDH